ncbi:LysR family transcriptional regulator [Legionella sp. D16C41]|uniref:LysR family transcriptional regulator n=1 Tax=Legionella sp. D16C41 TaxID=3402688 RepID=UPI003AF6AE8B
MKRQAYDVLGYMEIFVKVAESNNFSHAAAHLGMSPSSISKMIAKMEARLGVRLINRTTRTVSLTEDGEIYYNRVLRILSDIEETERLITFNQNKPHGKVRITCSAPFANHQLIPLMPELNQINPHIEIILFSDDRIVDILEERFDIAIRIGHLKNSSLKVRKLAETKRLLVASPAYLKNYDIPTHPNKLCEHICLNFYAHSILNNWCFKKADEQIDIEAKGFFNTNNGESLRSMVLAGGGIARLSAFMVSKDIKEGRLICLLPDWHPGELHPIYLLHSGNISRRVKFVIDYIFKKIGDKRFE